MHKRSKKPVLLALWVALVIKYLLLYLILMSKNQDYCFLAPGIRTASDFVYYLWLLLALPTFECYLFATQCTERLLAPLLLQGTTTY